MGVFLHTHMTPAYASFHLHFCSAAHENNAVFPCLSVPLPSTRRCENALARNTQQALLLSDATTEVLVKTERSILNIVSKHFSTICVIQVYYGIFVTCHYMAIHQHFGSEVI